MEPTEHSCALCGKPIETGEAWLTEDVEGGGRLAHSGCVYAEAMDPDERATWVPWESGPTE